MSGGRPRPHQQWRRQPRTLRTRLVVASVTLIAVVCAVIGTVTTIALHNHLYDQLNKSLDDVAMRASGLPPGADPGGQQPGSQPQGLDGKVIQDKDPLDFVVKGPKSELSIGAVVDGVDGAITRAEYGKEAQTSSTTRREMQSYDLNDAQKAALAKVSRDGKPHTANIPGLGEYQVRFTKGTHGTFYVALPTKDVNDTLNTLILVELSVTGAGLVAASLAGAAMVGVALRPLRRVVSTATRVSELPLHTGEVNMSERVPDTESDPHTEVGQVGAALNRMLDHVHGALHARQQSEMRVRQFVADASHELRTPLASIRGYAELTRRGREETGPDTRHALGRIESEASRMTLLVEDLLLLARLGAGRPLQFSQTDLVPLVVDTISDARAAGREHQWRLELPDEPALVSADAARLQQVLVNLLANARTHTPPGTTVTARVRRQGPWLCVDVQDNGPGIPQDLLPHVFERFARGDSARSRSTGSTGLGLAIVQAVAAAHEGAVTVDSVPGQTVFTLHLPPLPVEAAPHYSFDTFESYHATDSAEPVGTGETSPQTYAQAHHSTTTSA